jgi:ankyrin repeat protein
MPLIRYLLDKGANPLCGMCCDKYNAVDTAVVFGSSCEALSLLLTGVPEDKMNDGCSTSLWLAAQEGKIDMMNILLAAKVDPDFVSEDPESMLHYVLDDEMGWGTALHAAAWKNQTEAIELLLKAGAHKEAKNVRGLTPKNVAEEVGHEEAARLLS